VDTLGRAEAASTTLPKTRKGRERRSQILETAMRWFAVQGYRKVSLAAIAAEVVITEQGAMHYFPTEEHLLIGVLEHRNARDSEKWTRLFEEQPELTFLDAVTAIMQHNIENEPGLASLHTALMAEGVDPDNAGHAWFTEHNRRTRAQVAEIVAQEQDKGDIRSDLDPLDVAAQIIAMFEGLALQWSLDPGRVDGLVNPDL